MSTLNEKEKLLNLARKKNADGELCESEENEFTVLLNSAPAELRNEIIQLLKS